MIFILDANNARCNLARPGAEPIAIKTVACCEDVMPKNPVTPDDNGAAATGADQDLALILSKITADRLDDHELVTEYRKAKAGP